MFFLVYVSSALIPFSADDLLTLLASSRLKNQTLGVTGMLLFKDGNFMQVLEGEEPIVRDLYETITKDDRHWDWTVLLTGPIPERQFPQWSMAFQNLNALDLTSVPGYSEFLNVPLNSTEFSTHPSHCQKLLQLFKKSM